MAPGARRAPENRQTEGCSHASDNPVADAVRVSQPHHRARAGRRDRFFSARFASSAWYRALPDLAGRSQSRASGVARQRDVRDGHYTLRTASEPRVFSQINDEVAQALRDLIIDLVPPNQDLLIDAYCGAGFFRKSVARQIPTRDWD